MATRVSVAATPSSPHRTGQNRNLAKKLNIKMHLLTSNLLEMADICLSQPGISLAGREVEYLIRHGLVRGLEGWWDSGIVATPCGSSVCGQVHHLQLRW